jgi:hypothetical protein
MEVGIISLFTWSQLRTVRDRRYTERDARE